MNETGTASPMHANAPAGGPGSSHIWLVTVTDGSGCRHHIEFSSEPSADEFLADMTRQFPEQEYTVHEVSRDWQCACLMPCTVWETVYLH